MYTMANEDIAYSRQAGEITRKIPQRRGIMKGGKRMLKRLGKRSMTTDHSIAAYGCTCSCSVNCSCSCDCSSQCQTSAVMTTAGSTMHNGVGSIDATNVSGFLGRAVSTAVSNAACW